VTIAATPVLLGAAVVTAPAFYDALVVGTTSTETALLRFAIACLLVWVALGVVSMLVGPTPRAGLAAGAATADEPVEDTRVDGP
jgi:hypothetical protein